MPESLLNPTPISKYNQTPNVLVSKIVCGNSHCLILFNNGDLYGFGGNEEGQLGVAITNEESKYIGTLQKITFTLPNIEELKVEDIAAGDTFSLVLIRYNNTRTKVVRFGINQADKYRTNLNNVVVTSIEDVGNEENVEITKIAAFGKRKIVITQTNEIYLSGLDFSSMKLDEYVHFAVFNTQINSICLGANHCIIIDSNNDIYGLGDNTYGELGPYKLSLTSFTKIQFDNLKAPIAKISCGARHTLILLDNGELYCLGDNSEGQCYGFSTRISTPIKVNLDIKEKIVDCYCGYTHNMLVLDNGDVMSWGDASSGKLGYDEEHFTQTTPKVILNLKEKCVNKIGLGFQMSVITTGRYNGSVMDK